MFKLHKHDLYRSCGKRARAVLLLFKKKKKKTQYKIAECGKVAALLRDHGRAHSLTAASTMLVGTAGFTVYARSL